MSELEDIVDKWIGVRAITTNSPELIESVVDTRREEALRDFQAYTDRAVTLGRIAERESILYWTELALSEDSNAIIKYRTLQQKQIDRIAELNLTISVRDGGSPSDGGKTVEVITRHHKGKLDEYSVNGGETWMTKAEFVAKSPTEDNKESEA